MNNLNQRYPQQRPDQQRGVVLVLVTVAMLALLAMAALALDGGHLLLNKTRLQNAVDAAALSAARTVNDFPAETLPSDVHSAAQAAALDTFLNNLGLADNAELSNAYASSETALRVEFSDLLNPFTPNGDALSFVRVRAEDLNLSSWLLQVVGVNEKPVSASAVAGPIGLNASINKVLPIMVCGCDSEHTGTPADDCPGDPGDSFFGYPYDDELNYDLQNLADITVLKLSAGTGSDVGPGNFRLLDLGDATGANDLRDALAGVAEYSVDIGDNSEADTSTGNKAGPVSQGLNTRLGIYSGSLQEGDVPAHDPVTATFCSNGDCDVDAPVLSGPVPSNPNPLVFNNYDAEGNPIVERQDGSADISDIFDYQNYEHQYDSLFGATPCSEEGCRRREIALPIGDCSGTVSGDSQNVHIYNVACFFLLQEVGVGSDAEVFGQFIGSGCTAAGTFSNNPTTGPAPTKIVLYRDSDSGDS